MAAQLRLARKGTGKLYWLWSPALVLALLAGCTQAQKSGPAKSTTPQASGRPPAAKPAAPAPAANTGQAAPAPAPEKPARGAPAAEKPQAEKPKAEPQPVEKTAEAQPAESAQPPKWPVQEGQPMTEEQRDALAQMIRAAAEEGQKRQTAQQPPKTDQRAAAAQPSTTTQPGAEAQKAGCGATGGPPIDLTPLPPDQPQPKFACPQKKAVVEGVWQGKMAEFSFTIGNEGEAPLAVRIKPG